MGDLDYAPVEAPEEDEEEKRRREGPYPAVLPPSPAPRTMAAPAPDMAAPAMSMPAPPAPELAVSAPAMPSLAAQRPAWKDYAPAEPHGWAALGHNLAALNPLTNRIFNQMPEERAERNYKAATGEFDASETADLKNKQEQRAETTAQEEGPLKTAQTREANAHAATLENPAKPAKDPFALWMEQNPQHPVSEWFQAQQEGKPENEKDKDITDYLAANKLEDTPANREKARTSIANRSKDLSGKNEARGDRSYQFHASRIDKLATPIEQRAERIARLEDTLNQNSPQADALVAPELLTVMAGGQGSGLRMNEAEIARIVGGRDQWENIKAKLAAWQLDPSKPFAFQPEQRKQIRELFATIRQRVQQKMQILEEGRGQLVESDDPHEHRRIVNQLQQKLDAVDSGQGGGFQVPPGAPAAPKEDGHILKANGKPIAVSKGGQWVAPQ